MWCAKCNHDLSECSCPDLQERLASLGQSKHIAIKVCVTCGLHYSQCKCETPDFKMKAGGKISDLPNLGGE